MQSCVSRNGVNPQGLFGVYPRKREYLGGCESADHPKLPLRPRISCVRIGTLNEVIAGGKVSWVLEADLKNFFGSLSHEWVLRFVEHRVGDPRIACLVPAPPA